MANETVWIIWMVKNRLMQKLRGSVTRGMKVVQSPSRVHSWKMILIPLPQKSEDQVSKVLS